MEIIVETQIKAPLESVWEAWTTPAILQEWNGSACDWYCPRAEIDLHEGGHFFYRIEKTDGSETVDFEGVFKRLKLLRLIEYKSYDGKKVCIHFRENPEGTKIFETIEIDPNVATDLQTERLENILAYFKKVVETNRLLS